MPPAPPSSAVVRAWILNYVCTALHLEPRNVSLTAPFDGYGFDSVEAVIMAGAMEDEFGLEIDPSIFFEDFSINGIVIALQAMRLVSPEPVNASAERPQES